MKKRSLFSIPALLLLLAACNSATDNKKEETTVVDTSTTTTTTTVETPATEPAAAEPVVPAHVAAAVSTAKPMTHKKHHSVTKKKVKKADGKEVEQTATIVFYEFVPDVEAPATPPPPATTPAADRPKDAENFHYTPDKKPSYPGGEKALDTYLEKNLVYPAAALDNGIEGTVLLRFSVDEFGKVYPPKVVSKPLGYGLEEEAIRIVEKMPKWNPGTIQGKVVKTRFTLPVKFELED